MNRRFRNGISHELNVIHPNYLSSKQRNEYSRYLTILKEIETIWEKNKSSHNSEKRKITESFIHTFSEQLEINFKCPICQILVSQPIILACSHLFCKSCLNDWMTIVESRGDLRSCPICRRIIRQNFTDPQESTALSSLQLFFRKIKDLEALFKHQQSIPEEDRLHRLLDVLELPRNFKNLETMYILKNNLDQYNEEVLVRQSTMVGCVQLIRLLRTAENDNVKGEKVPKTGWQIFLNRINNTCKMLCPRWLPSTLSSVTDFLFPPPNGYSWVWTRPGRLFYFWASFSLIYIFIVLTFGPTMLHWMGVKHQAKRLIQHGIFICLDIPTFEIINIIYEAFTNPL